MSGLKQNLLTGESLSDGSRMASPLENEEVDFHAGYGGGFEPLSEQEGAILDLLRLREGSKVRAILELIKSSRLLEAKKKHSELIGNLLSAHFSEEEEAVTRVLLDHYDPKISKYLDRAKEVESVISAGSAVSSGDWELGSHMFGVTTHYKTLSSGLLCIHTEGSQDNLPIFEQLAVLNEVKLWHIYMPFCNKSELVTKVNETELVGYFNISLKLLTRDSAIHAYGVDCLYEHGKIVMIGKSVSEWPGCKIPFDSGWTHSDMDIKEFNAIIDVTSPTSAKTCMIFTIDPKVRVPQSIINFAVKNLAGLLLCRIQNEAKKASDEPETSPYAKAIKNNKPFYRDWLLTKLSAYCEFKGWGRVVCEALGGAGEGEVVVHGVGVKIVDVPWDNPPPPPFLAESRNSGVSGNRSSSQASQQRVKSEDSADADVKQTGKISCCVLS